MPARRQGPDLSAVAAELRDRASTRNIAVALGVKLRKVAASRYVGLCPVHAERSGSFNVGGPGGADTWHCFGCHAGGGDALSLAMAVLGLDFPAGVRWLADQVGYLIDESPQAALRTAPRVRPAPRLVEPDAPPPSAPLGLPLDEVDALWRWCVRVSDDAEVSAYLRSRAIDPGEVAARDLARALPGWAPLPAWASYGRRSWQAAGWRLVVPMFDATGRLALLRGRWCGVDDQGERIPPPMGRHGKKAPKSLAPRGSKIGPGAVMADEAARIMLMHDTAPMRLVISEGEPDWLTWATRLEQNTAVLGVTGGGRMGSWSDELAARVPEGSEVVIRTDDDLAGDKLADAIAASLAGRGCNLQRQRIPRESR